MKHNFRCGVPLMIFILFLIAISPTHTSARFIKHTKQGEKMVELDESINNNEESSVDLEAINSFNEMMGMEECGNGDEECLNRRLLAEAHLDYIYTQQHKH
uniref:putative phytosulfokines 6 n=1 Tax=Erigeron canadensis TaxID=72917 RepID=UPI001CB95699|nr:putative phytosulfokines 6 [Erigeron canadensis]